MYLYLENYYINLILKLSIDNKLFACYTLINTKSKEALMKKNRKWVNICISAGAVLLLLSVWHLCTDVLGLVSTKAMPGPAMVLNTLVTKLTSKSPDGATLPVHLWASISITLGGFAIGSAIGIPLGIWMAWNDTVDRYVRPVFDFIRSVPAIAWVPLLLLLFGIGHLSKIMVIVIAALAPTVLNAYSGVKQTREVHLWVARTYGASNSQMLWTLAIPTALPFILTGLRVAIALSWSCIVAAEMLASNKGIGYMIQQGRFTSRPTLTIVGMIAIAACGALLTFIVGCVEKLVLKGRRR